MIAKTIFNQDAQTRQEVFSMCFSSIPSDPVMLYSYLNTKLRDQYHSFDALCEDLNLNQEEITAKLAAFDFHYDKEKNQFR